MVGSIDTILSMVLSLHLWLFVIGGVVFGYVVGAIPGFGGGNILAMLVPFTIHLQPVDTLVFFSAIYGSMELGGSWPGIILNVPGSPASAAASLEGFIMSRRGEGDRALGLSIMSSIVGLVAGTIVLLTLTEAVGSVALAFSPRDMCALIVLGLSFVASLGNGTLYCNVISALIGLLLATIGTGPLSGAHRGTLGIVDLYDGMQLLPVVVGLFGFAECLVMASRASASVVSAAGRVGEFRHTLAGVAETFRHKKVLAFSCLLGMVMGIVPGLGGTASSWIAYAQAKRVFGKHEKFGDGAAAGIIAPEVANHVGVPEGLISMLALGIPHSGAGAIMMSALILEGVTPGPAFLRQNHAAVMTIGVSILLGTIVIFIVGLLFSRYFAKIAMVPSHILVPIIAVACLLGAYGQRDSFFDMGTVVAFGVVGVLFEKLGLSRPVFLLAFILGPMFETYLGQSLSIGNGSVFYLVGSPIAAPLYLCAFVFLAGPFVVRALKAGWSAARST